MYSSFKKHQLIIESWRRFLLKESSSEATSYLDDILSDTHASGRPISDIFRQIIDEDSEQEENSPLDLISLLRPEFLAEVIKNPPPNPDELIDIGAILRDSNIRMIDRIKKIAVYNSIILFTGGSPEAVRDPEKFTRALAKGKGGRSIETGKSYELGIDTEKYSYVFKATKQMYKIANHVMNVLSTMETPTPTNTIYRGLRLPKEVFEGLQVGDVFNSRGPSSWSTKNEIASKFVNIGTVEDYSPEDVGVVFETSSPEYGSDISRFSVYPEENEFILGRPVRIDAIDNTIGSRGFVSIKCEVL